MARQKQQLTQRQKRGNATRRKRAVRKWCNTTARKLAFISLVVAVLAATGGSWWFWHSGRLGQAVANVSNSFWQKTAGLGFEVKDVYLEGRNYTAVKDVNDALNVKLGDPILALSLPELRKRLEEIPRVKYAELARVLPDQLHVKLVERAPAAIWQNNGKLNLIDLDGVVMEYVDIRHFPSLLLVVGEDAPAHAHELLETLASAPEMAPQVTSAVRVGERRWNLRFKNGLELKLPEQDTTLAWKQFATMEKEHHILSRPIEYVDMRLGDKVFIKNQPAPQQDKPSAKPAPSDSKT